MGSGERDYFLIGHEVLNLATEFEETQTDTVLVTHQRLHPTTGEIDPSAKVVITLRGIDLPSEGIPRDVVDIDAKAGADKLIAGLVPNDPENTAGLSRSDCATLCSCWVLIPYSVSLDSLSPKYRRHKESRGGPDSSP